MAGSTRDSRVRVLVNVLDAVGPIVAPGGSPASEATVESGVESGSASRDLEDLLEAGVRAVLDSISIPEAEISLTLVDDARIRELNRRYLDRDRPTDVLAFPLYQAGEPVVGDVYVGVDQARRQAPEHGVPLGEELLRLAVHGTLHVLGYEHPEGDEEGEGESAREESAMFGLQEELVAAVLSDAGSSTDGGSTTGAGSSAGAGS